MEIKTTINMNNDTLLKLNIASSHLNISRTFIIKLLLKAILEDADELSKLFSGVQYQVRREKCQWHKFHIALSPGEYELSMDFRKMFKMSLSFIVALAVSRYLDKIIKKFEQKKDDIIHGDNSACTNYLVSGRVIDGVITWKIYWGIIPGIEKHLN